MGKAPYKLPRLADKLKRPLVPTPLQILSLSLLDQHMDSGMHRIVVDVIHASSERFQREHAFEGISDLFAIQ